MNTRSANIDRLRIATPCPVSWDQMSGDNRVRFCEQCRLNVFNISELSRFEVESLIASTEGRLCARLYRRADGTVLTKDCPVGLRALRMRVSKRTAAVFAAIAGITSAIIGQQTPTKDSKTACTPQTRITRSKVSSDQTLNHLSGSVVDPGGAAIAQAKITLTNTDTKVTASAITNDAGTFEFTSVPAGNYSITIEATDFVTHKVTDIILEKDRSLDFNIILNPQGELLSGIVDMSLVFDSTPGTTIITEQMIRRLPIQ